MKEVVFAGFGGQGILLGGHVLAHIMMDKGLEVTWMPSYGPAMRGGSATCVVKFGNELVSNPDAEETDLLIAMNEPGLKKCLPDVLPNGYVLINSNSTALTKGDRNDVHYIVLPCVEMAEKAGSSKSANFVMLGAAAKLGKLFDCEEGIKGIESFLGAEAKPAILAANISAFKAGYELF